MARGNTRMAEDGATQASSATQAQAADTLPETFIVMNGTLVHDGQAFPVGAQFLSDDAETIRALLACRAIARPGEVMHSQQVAKTLDENASLRSQVQKLERELAGALAAIEKRERVI